MITRSSKPSYGDRYWVLCYQSAPAGPVPVRPVSAGAKPYRHQTASIGEEVVSGNLGFRFLDLDVDLRGAQQKDPRGHALDGSTHAEHHAR